MAYILIWKNSPLMLFLVASLNVFQGITAAKNVSMTDVRAVEGEPAYLPCDISTPEPDDAVLLVLWYREDLGTPIYSVDARERDFSVAERWSDAGAFAARAYFLPERQPAQLGVDRARAADAAVYRCRVDFRRAQTRNSRVNLTIIVPPKRIVITDDLGMEKKAIVGPYQEGANLTLHCDVLQGEPAPWVRWYRDDTELASAVITSEGRGLRATITVTNLTRNDVRASLACRANNNNRTAPLEAALHLDMNLEPLSVRILDSQQPLVAARRYDLLCQSSGSRPPATITWWKDDRRLDNTKETTSTDGNTTTSTLSLIVSRADTGARLTCRAHNPALSPPPTPLHDDWLLDVQYIPEASVRLGTSLNFQNIREGSDVYFDCIIHAHPYVYKVEWRHNGHMLQHNVGAGVIVSNQSLVLQGVGRRTAGNYSCVGYNAEGDAESKPFLLDVLFAPTCATPQQRVYVARLEKAQVTCRVDANPPDVQFRWMFNNTADSMEVSGSHVQRLGTSSTVAYTPTSELDYGTLLCWASNRIGAQRLPCVHQIIAAGRPDQVHNCSVQNVSMTAFAVRCSEGFNGGLPQSFLLEVRDAATQEFVLNLTSAAALFTSTGLTAGRAYEARVFAYNAKGRGDAHLLRARTLQPPHMQPTAAADKAFESPRLAFRVTPTLGALLGGAVAAVALSLLTLVALRNQCNKGNRRHDLKSADVDVVDVGTVGVGGGGGRRTSPAGAAFDSPAREDKASGIGNLEPDDRNPDIIPDLHDPHMQVDFFMRPRQLQRGRGAGVSVIDGHNGKAGSAGETEITASATTHIAPRTLGYCPLPQARTMHHITNMEEGTFPPLPTCHDAVRSDVSGSCTLPRGTAVTGANARWPAYTPVATFSHVPIALQHPPFRQSARTLPRGHRAHPQSATPLLMSKAHTTPASSLPHPQTNAPAAVEDTLHTRPLVARDKCESSV